MKSQSLARFLKSRWTFAIVAVAALAFLAAALISNRGVADETPPAAAPNPAATGWWWATPTHEEFSRDMEEFRAKQVAGGNDGENRSGRSRVHIPTPVPRSAAEAEAWSALLEGAAMYFPPSDKVIHLPEGVAVGRWIPAANCGVWCPYAPVYMLRNGDATVHLDARGNVISPLPLGADVDYPDADDPDAFPFLYEE